MYYTCQVRHCVTAYLNIFVKCPPCSAHVDPGDRLGIGRPPADRLRRVKMERVSEVLQLPVVIEGRRTLAFEPQPLEEREFLLSCAAAEGRILKEFLEPRVFDHQLVGLPFDELESLHMPRDHSGI